MGVGYDRNALLSLYSATNSVFARLGFPAVLFANHGPASPAAKNAKSSRALASAWNHLIDSEAKRARLRWPPFDAGLRDPGYISAYSPEIQENGGQYNHAATQCRLSVTYELYASNSRKLRPLVSRPAQAMRPQERAVGTNRTSAVPPRVGIRPMSAKPCTATPPNLLLPATSPVARPRIPSG